MRRQITRPKISGVVSHLLASPEMVSPRVNIRSFIWSPESAILPRWTECLDRHISEQPESIPSGLELQELFSVKKKASKTRGRKPSRPPLPSSAVGARIKRARLSKGLSLQTVGDEIGISNQAVSLIETGGSNPAERTLRLLAQILKDDFGLPWLREYARDTEVTIPVVAKVAAGSPVDETIEGESVAIDPNFIKTSGDICALRVAGDSMIADHILDGDILVCRKNPSQPPKDALVVVDFRSGQGAAVKRWRRKGEQFILSSDHYLPESPRYEHSMAEIGKLYEVVGLIRSLK